MVLRVDAAYMVQGSMDNSTGICFQGMHAHVIAIQHFKRHGVRTVHGRGICNLLKAY
jgi:hypothetical protein